MVRPSVGGGIAGFVADQLMNTFPLGTLGGTFHKALFDFAAGDMNQAYDPARATQGTRTHDFGDLRGMGSGLFGDIAAVLKKHLQEARTSPQRSNGPDRRPDDTSSPRTDADARANARPQVTQEAQQQAQAQSGMGGWGKALLYGGLALGGLSLLRDYTMGGFGMPFYGGMNPLMMGGGMPYMMPGMMPGLFW